MIIPRAIQPALAGIAAFVGIIALLHMVDRVSLGMAVCRTPAACPLELPEPTLPESGQ